MYLLFSPCHVISPVGLSQYLFWFLLVPLEVPAVLTSLISLLWLPRVNTQKKLFQSGSHCFFSPWITFSSSFLLCHPGNDKGRYFPFYILGAEPHVFNSFFLFMMHSWYVLYRTWLGVHTTVQGTLRVKLSTAHWGLGTKSYVTQSVLFSILSVLTLGVSLLSC